LITKHTNIIKKQSKIKRKIIYFYLIIDQTDKKMAWTPENERKPAPNPKIIKKVLTFVKNQGSCEKSGFWGGIIAPLIEFPLSQKSAFAVVVVKIC